MLEPQTGTKWEARGEESFRGWVQARSNMLSIGLPQKAYGDLPLQSYGIGGAFLDLAREEVI